jgi:hypothetical protein
MATYLEVEYTVTLMRLTDPGYVESGDRTFLYYYAAPDAWAALPDRELQARAFATAERTYVDLNERLRAAEPGDPNYLRVKSTRARVLGTDEANSWPWVSARPPVWEPSPCVVVHADGTYAKVHALEFGNAVPSERERVRLDAVLPSLLERHLPACAAEYERAVATYRDPRPLDARSRLVWGAAVLFFCVLDRLATGGELADPQATLDGMISRLATDGATPRDDVESARQIYRRLVEQRPHRPGDPLFQTIYERAWAVRYAEFDPRTPSAFQGFVRCLVASAERLATLDFDGGGTAAAAASPIYEKIAAFNRTVLLPAFEEIKTTLERKGKRAIVAEDDRLGDEFLESVYREMHPGGRLARELLTSPPTADELADGTARYLGPTIVCIDPEPAESRYAGKYFETIVFVVGPNDAVYASPFVLYHMKFDNKLHAFAHRFDNAQPLQPIETIDKYAVQNHFLGAYDFFKLHARSDQRPW